MFLLAYSSQPENSLNVKDEPVRLRDGTAFMSRYCWSADFVTYVRVRPHCYTSTRSWRTMNERISRRQLLIRSAASACPGYVVDHVKALACGGADAPSNMQSQTIAEGKAKDKWERIGCQ